MMTLVSMSYPRYTPSHRGFDIFDGVYNGDGDSSKEEHNSEVYAEKAVQFIKKEANNGPFFIYLSMLTKSYPRERNNDPSLIAKSREEKIASMDRAVEMVVKSLLDEKIYNNTVIGFVSDNGGR